MKKRTYSMTTQQIRISRYILLFTSLVLMNGIHLYLTMYTQRINQANDPTEKFQFDPRLDAFDDYINMSLPITTQISSTHNLLGNKHITQREVTFEFFSMKRQLKSSNQEGKSPCDIGGRIICQLMQYLH